MHTPRPVQFTVGSEDGSPTAPNVIGNIVRASLRLVDDRIQEKKIQWHYCETKVGPWRALRKNLWKSTSQQDHHATVEFVRTIASELTRQDRIVLVVLHVDGDTTWKARARSENATKFEEIIRKRVQMALHAHLCFKKPGPHPDPDTETARCMMRLVLVMPFYSIESWLYQATACAIRLCHSQHQGRDITTFEGWAADRSRLDEELKPKERVCLGSEHNLTLSTEFPAQAVLAAEKSYFTFAQALTKNAEVLAALSVLRESG